MDKEIDRVLEQIADPAERIEVAAAALQGKHTRNGNEYPAWVGQSHTARIIATIGRHQ